MTPLSRFWAFWRQVSSLESVFTVVEHMARRLLCRRRDGWGGRVYARSVSTVGLWSVTWVTLTGCIIAPALPVEDAPPNLPPLISDDFVTPRDVEVTIPREDAVTAFVVSQFLDANDNELLDVIWYSPHTVGAEVLQIGFASPDTANPDLYRGVFTRYTGSQLSVDPCSGAWRGVDSATLYVYVADGRMRIDDAGTPVIPEDSYVDSHSWAITFSGECPEL